MNNVRAAKSRLFLKMVDRERMTVDKSGDGGSGASADQILAKSAGVE